MNFGKLIVVMLVLLTASSFASAVDLEVFDVLIDGEAVDFYDDTYSLEVERGQELDIKIRVLATGDVVNAQIEADIYGYKYAHKEGALVSDATRTFDLAENDYKTFTLNLEVPTKMDKKYTTLRLRLGDEKGISFEERVELHVVGIDEEDAVQIKDYSFSPSTSVNAGRAFTATVKVENIGDSDLDDVKVTVAVPALNIQDSEYLDELEADEKETLEEFLLRIPNCAEPGTYDVVITAEFDEFETSKETTQITVLEGDACSERTYGEERTTVTAPDRKEANAGEDVEFPIIITNKGDSTKIYTLVVSGVDSWGSSTISPGAQLVLAGGETKVAYLNIETDADADGERLFLVTVATGGETETVPLTVSIDGDEVDEADDAQSTDFKRVLEIALIVLVIILIIIGLIVGFNKLRGRDEEDDTQTYY